MKESAFWQFSLLVEKYYLETFTLEALVILTLLPSLRLIEELLVAAVIAISISEGLKLLVREKRPKNAPERKIQRRIFRLNLRSFPSTHSAVALTFAGVLLNSIIFFPVLAFGILVAYTRVYIKSHYWHDIIAGGIIGFLVGYSVLFVFG